MLGVSHQAVHVWHNTWTQGGAHAPPLAGKEPTPC